MDKNEAIKLVLVDVCCGYGKEFCDLCPLRNIKCEDVKITPKDLLEAVELLSRNCH